jgi:uncharacterized membrane protein YfcA
MTRGAWLAGVTTHPVGALIFTLACLSIPASLIAAMRGASVHKALESPHLRRVCTALANALLIQWIVSMLRTAL